MTRGRRLAGPRLSVAALAAAAALTFGAGASADETCPAEEIPQPVSVELARQQQRPEKAEKTEKAVEVDDAEKPAKKKPNKAKKSEPNPIEAVHFAQFIVQ